MPCTRVPLGVRVCHHTAANLLQRINSRLSSMCFSKYDVRCLGMKKGVQTGYRDPSFPLIWAEDVPEY